MKDNSFALAMEKIVGQAEAEKKQEIHAQKRAVKVARARSIFVYLFILTLAVFAFCYREKIQSLVFAKPAKQSDGRTSVALDAAAKNAATRDRVIDDIAK